MKLYVGNLSFSVTDEELHAAFAAHGSVASAKVIRDRETNESRGFGFVEMADAAEAQTAIDRMNGAPLKGRPLRVNEAQERADARGGAPRPVYGAPRRRA